MATIYEPAHSLARHPVYCWCSWSYTGRTVPWSPCTRDADSPEGITDE